MILNIWIHINIISFSFLYGFLKEKYLNRIGKNISHMRGGMFDNGNINWYMLEGHFCVELGIILSNRAFLCRTMYFAVEPGFFCGERVL